MSSILRRLGGGEQTRLIIVVLMVSLEGRKQLWLAPFACAERVVLTLLE